MQFLSTTWDAWGRVAPDRPPEAVADPHNAWDAIYSAAAYLCGGEPAVADLEAAILRYNRSDAVPRRRPRQGRGVRPRRRSRRGRRLRRPRRRGRRRRHDPARRPVRLGRRVTNRGFDCSGLVQWSYAQIGVNCHAPPASRSPRRRRADLSQLRPGDLLFTDSNRGGTIVAYGHVAIYAGGGMQIAAPRTGDVVKLQPVPYDRLRAAAGFSTADQPDLDDLAPGNVRSIPWQGRRPSRLSDCA